MNAHIPAIPQNTDLKMCTFSSISPSRHEIMTRVKTQEQSGSTTLDTIDDPKHVFIVNEEGVRQRIQLGIEE